MFQIIKYYACCEKKNICSNFKNFIVIKLIENCEFAPTEVQQDKDLMRHMPFTFLIISVYFKSEKFDIIFLYMNLIHYIYLILLARFVNCLLIVRVLLLGY